MQLLSQSWENPFVFWNISEIKQTIGIHYNIFIVGTSCKKIMQEIDKEDGDRINVSISRKAYEAIAKYTRQLNEKDIKNKPFTIEDVLDEEIIFLFSDEWS